jgi:hypothetical protein
MGRSRDIAATGPKPGSTPIKVPKRTAIKHASKLGGAKLTEKPYMSLLKIAISSVLSLKKRLIALKPFVYRYLE